MASSGAKGRPVIAILAAGSSRRMRGTDKLLEPVAGEPVLRRIARAALSTELRVAVTLRVPDPTRTAALTGLELALLPVPEADEGMAASIRAAAGWALAQAASALIICPGDLPELEGDDFARIVQAFDPAGPPLRATDAGGRAGHPVAFPAWLLHQLTRVSGDRGARDILAAHPPRTLALPGCRATCDLDTPEDWANWRARTGGTDRP